MREWFSPVCVGLGAAALTFLMEPWFPLGDWRWAVVAGVAFVAAAAPYRWDGVRARFVAVRRSLRALQSVDDRLNKIERRQRKDLLARMDHEADRRKSRR